MSAFLTIVRTSGSKAATQPAVVTPYGTAPRRTLITNVVKSGGGGGGGGSLSFTGTYTTSGAYTRFTGNGTVTVTATTIVNYFAVGGGGGGGGFVAGGGGAGGLQQGSLVLTAGTYAVTIGNGGPGGVNQFAPSASGGGVCNGGNTTFGALVTALGGGGGGTYAAIAAGDGGCGGGSSTGVAYGIGSQGYNGGGNTNNSYGAGGGGIGGPGALGNGSTGANGGIGVTFNGVQYGGGGAGGGGGSFGGGGGTGTYGGGSGPSGTGTANTGGGGAGGNSNNIGGAGGSGIFIIYPVPSVPSGVITNGLLSFFTFDNTIVDSVGAITLTLTGSVSYVSGRRSQAVYLANETNSAAATFATNYLTSSYSLTTPFSVSLWFNPTNTNRGCLISTYNSTSAFNNGVDIYIAGGAVSAAYNNVQNVGSSYSISNGTWYHVVVTVNASNLLTFYVNGSQVGNQITQSIYSNGLMIGCVRDGGSMYAYSGYMDDYRIYNRVLSGSEISQIYAGTG